jgi:hypothetical protein
MSQYEVDILIFLYLSLALVLNSYEEMGYEEIQIILNHRNNEKLFKRYKFSLQNFSDEIFHPKMHVEM